MKYSIDSNVKLKISWFIYFIILKLDSKFIENYFNEMRIEFAFFCYFFLIKENWIKIYLKS